MITCVRKEDVFQEVQLLRKQLDLLLQLLIFCLELGHLVGRLLGLLSRLLTRPLDGLVVPGSLGQVVGVRHLFSVGLGRGRGF